MKRIQLFCLAALTGFSAMAVPAKPGMLSFAQSDGSVAEVQLLGDEYHHLYLSEDGYPLIEKEGNFYFAKVDAGGELAPTPYRMAKADARSMELKNLLAATDKEEMLMRLSAKGEKIRTALKEKESRLATQGEKERRQVRAADPDGNGYTPGPGLMPGSFFPVKGKQKGLVILVEYADVAFKVEDPQNYFERMLNEKGFSDDGGTGSARDYFLEMSSGQFDPDFDVYGPVKLSHEMKYYGGNEGGHDRNPQAMAIEACDRLDPYVDFSQYDRDGDGVIDNVFIFYAGRGEASGGGANTVWPHAGYIDPYGQSSHVYDGVRLRRYACTNERGASLVDGIGTFTHEFSHVLGLPDIYATSYTSAVTPGAWSVMDRGSYNNNSRTPPCYGAFERYALGWSRPLEMTEPANATLLPIISNQSGIMRLNSDKEYFLVENRQKDGWDAFIPYHGMLLWHVDYDEMVWAYNTVNNEATHQYMDLVEANGVESDYQRSGNPFPGTGNVTSITSDTKPGLVGWDGTPLKITISDITERAGEIRFVLNGGKELEADAPVALEPNDVASKKFTARWEKEDGKDYVISVYTYDSFDGKPRGNSNRKWLPDYAHRPVGNTDQIEIGGLEPERYYYYTVAEGDGWQQGAPSNEIEVLTEELALHERPAVALEVAETGADYFVATWNKEPEADDYLLTVYTDQMLEGYKAVNDFSADPVMPEGWECPELELNSTRVMYAGVSVPSIMLPADKTYISSPEYADSVIGFSFWHRGRSTSADDKINVWLNIDGSWELHDVIPVSTAGGGILTEFKELPESTLAVKLEYCQTSGSGMLAIDDISIWHGKLYDLLPIVELTDIRTGDTDRYKVEGLEAERRYAYTVKAVTPERESLPSNMIEVMTDAATNSVTEIGSERIVCTVSDRDVRILNIAEGAMVTLTDLAGKTLYHGACDRHGEMTVTVPCGGVYILRVGTATAKLMVK